MVRKLQDKGSPWQTNVFFTARRKLIDWPVKWLTLFWFSLLVSIEARICRFRNTYFTVRPIGRKRSDIFQIWWTGALWNAAPNGHILIPRDLVYSNPILCTEYTNRSIVLLCKRRMFFFGQNLVAEMLKLAE